jgi:hypothetical protein
VKKKRMRKRTRIYPVNFLERKSKQKRKRREERQLLRESVIMPPLLEMTIYSGNNRLLTSKE